MEVVEILHIFACILIFPNLLFRKKISMKESTFYWFIICILELL